MIKTLEEAFASAEPKKKLSQRDIVMLWIKYNSPDEVPRPLMGGWEHQQTDSLGIVYPKVCSRDSIIQSKESDTHSILFPTQRKNN